MNELRSNLGQWNENKGALMHTWMRQLQRGRIQDYIAKEDQVEIEGAGAVGDAVAAVAAEIALDGQEAVKQRLGIKIGVECDSGVQKGRLVRVAHGLGGVAAGSGGDPAQLTEADNRGIEGLRG